ncbi:MAG: hypothetical protein AAGG68_13920 [Bacteroidota bacterium]
MKFLLISTFLLITFYATAQTPILVSDFNAGDADAFNTGSRGIVFEDKLILTIKSNEYGEEVGMLEGDELVLLKDINIGPRGSRPSAYTVYKDRVYFSAYDDTNHEALWVTDGTAEGTQLFFDPHPNSTIISSSRIREMIVSEAGNLFFRYNNGLYRTDGNTVRFIREVSSSNSIILENMVTKFEDGVAYIDITNQTLRIFKAMESGIRLLARTTLENSSNMRFSYFSEVENGLVLAIEGPISDELSGFYLYNSTTEQFDVLPIDGTDFIPKRVLDIGETFDLAWMNSRGLYSIKGDTVEDQYLYETSSFWSMTQDEQIPFVVTKDQILTTLKEGSFDMSIILSDGTVNGTYKLFETDVFLSDMVSQEGLVFFASGVSNGFTPKIHSVDVVSGTHKILYEFEQRSTSLQSVIPVGILENRLYFIGTQDEEVGRELYYIKFKEDAVNTFELRLPEYDIRMYSNGFQVLSDLSLPVEVKLFDEVGRQLTTIHSTTNTFEFLDVWQGKFFLRFNVGGVVVSKVFFRF